MATINYERAARAVVDADYLGNTATAKKYGLSHRTLQNYRTRYREDALLRQRADEFRQTVRAKAAVEFGEARQNITAEAVQRIAAEDGQTRYTESELQKAVLGKIDDVLSLLGLPAAVAVSSEYVLPNGMRVDILVKHLDDSYTIIETKAAGGDAKKGAGWLLYSTIGQLLYYAEVITDAYGVDHHRLNLCVIADYDPDVYYLRSLERVAARVRFHNIRPFLAHAL
jgi:transposase